MIRSRLLLASLLLLSAPLAAQDGPTTPEAPAAPAFDADAAEANAKELLAGMTDLDEALLGTYRYGLHMGGSKNLGTFVLELTKAPEESGGVYQADVKMVMGPLGQRSALVILDAQLALVSSTGEETRQGVISKTRLVMEGGQWSHTKTVGTDAPVTQTFPADGPDHTGIHTGLLLAGKLDPSKAYLFRGVHWEGAEPKADTVTVTCEGKHTIKHRGEEVEVTKLVVAEGVTKEITDMLVDGEKKVLQLGPRGAPILLVAGDAEEITKDLPVEEKPAAAAGAGAASPKAAVIVYFKVLSKAKKVEALDAIMDWEAIREEMIKGNPETKILDANGIANLLKDQFRQAEAPIDDAQVEMLAALLAEEVSEETATVSMPGSDDPFRLRKTESGWMITHFPH